MLGAVVVLALAALLIVTAQATKIGWHLTPVYPGAVLATAIVITRLILTHAARFAALALLSAFAIPGMLYGRGSFVNDYNIVDYSPDIRSFKSAEPFTSGRVKTLYLLGVSDPAARFYLTPDVRRIDQPEFEALIHGKKPFYCLTYEKIAAELLKNDQASGLRITAAAGPLVILERG